MDINTFLEKSLIDQKLIDPEKLENIKQLVTKGNALADVLTDQQLIDEDSILNILSEYFGITAINLNYYMPDEEIVAEVPIGLCDKYKIFPLFKIKNTLIIATANPSDVHAMDEIRVKTGYGIEPLLALPRSIDNAIAKFYSMGDSVSNMLDTIKKDEDEEVIQTQEERQLIEAASDEPIVKLVNLFISQALRDRASDIHINPDKDRLRIRNRIDGFLYEVAQPPKKFQSAIISRIKILANIDIAERRRPQDGRIEVKVDNRPIDLRVSTFPTIYGENVVMRVLDKGSVLVGLEELGFSQHDLTLFNTLIRKPYGIMLTSGPTGSGKTTTLYAALETINSVEKNIMTLEDPVEYDLQLIRQSQVNPKTNFTFASGLRAILRQDPDIILVGEIRDIETATISIQAALTGHLVFSTLHTNDAASCIVRLCDMGIQNFLTGSTLIGALSQRLVRRLCESCKEEYEPPQHIIKDLAFEPPPGTKFYRGKGCQNCRGIGYKGRVGIFELMEITPRIQRAILKKAYETELRDIAREEGMTTLREDGIAKVMQGLTTLDEVILTTRMF